MGEDKFIPPSELIINPDNSIYHLKLRPDEIADTIITVGDPDRVTMVSQYLDKIHLERSCREFKTITGELAGQPLTIISTGIGTDNIDIVFNELDALANIDFTTRQIKDNQRQLTFIRIGTSGAISKDIPLDSFIVSHHAIGFEGLLNFYDAHHVRNAELEKQVVTDLNYYAVDANTDLIEVFSKIAKPGITITANGFYGPQSRQLRLKHSFNVPTIASNIKYKGLSPTNLEMETAGIYGMAALLGHKAISLNAILANRVTNEFSGQPAKTVKSLVEQSLSIIQQL